MSVREGRKKTENENCNIQCKKVICFKKNSKYLRLEWYFKDYLPIALP